MQIKESALLQQLQKKIAPLYLLIGQDTYLLGQSLDRITIALKKSHELDEKIISLETTEDWKLLVSEANSYSLFAEMVMINAVYDKKTINAAEKNTLTSYLDSVNQRCTIIITAPNLAIKSLQALSRHDNAVVVLNQPLEAPDMKRWIAKQLSNKAIAFEPTILDLIHQYSQGNMLACAQFIEKISLAEQPNSYINAQQALEHLSNQCEHSPFELIEACLLGKTAQVLQIMRNAADNKTESTLILWILTHELRILLQLFAASKKKLDLKIVCSQLKIWPQRLKLYQACLQRQNDAHLSKMLCYSQMIDERIKSNNNHKVWNALECLALALCLGQFIGEMAGLLS